MRRAAAVIILVFCAWCRISAGVGESAVITLIFPFGARSCGMGEVGTALADDESALFFNPAGLAAQNKRWRNGTGSVFIESLLPALHIPELWHLAVSANYQGPDPAWGGFGFFYNYINMGENTLSDFYGRETRVVHSWEMAFALGWGFNFYEWGDTTHNVGITVKPFISALAPGMGSRGEGIGNGVAIDIGYLWLIGSGFRLGFTLMNMGTDVFYIDQENLDPVPFTANLALGYKRGFEIEDVHFLDVAAELRLNKELVVNHYNGDPDPFWKAMFTDWTNEPFRYEMAEINIHEGVELGFMRTGFVRQGWLIDYIGERYELTLGAGLGLFNHLSWDFSFIISPRGFLKRPLQKINPEKEGATGVRNGQWRISFTLNGFGNWSEGDFSWWKE